LFVRELSESIHHVPEFLNVQARIPARDLEVAVPERCGDPVQGNRCIECSGFGLKRNVCGQQKKSFPLGST
jgi:hypothetical protein